jgi:hypothetical protein
MKATTETGSVYEIDTASKKIRRLNGKGDPTPRIGKDEIWRSFDSIFPEPIVVGSGMLIAYGSDVELLSETKLELEETGGSAVPTTMTSRVVEIEEDT